MCTYKAMQSINKLPVVVLWLSALLMLTSSCQHNYIVKGTTDASVFQGSSIALKVLTGRYQWTSLDSCEVTHGMFVMKGRMDSVVFATLFLDDIPVMPIIIEPGILHVNISSLSLSASGTRLNNELYDFLGRRNELQTRVTELGHTESQMIMDGASTDAVHHYVDSVYGVITDSMDLLLHNLTPFIRDHLIAFSSPQ